jgi:hypothetical protein
MTYPCEPVNGDKKITTGNDARRRRAVDNELDIAVGVIDRVSVNSHQPTDGEVENRAQDTTIDEQVSATSLLDEHKSDTGCDQEDDVLNGGGDEIDVASQTSHLEDVDNVVHHHVSTEKLLPELSEHSGGGLSPHLRSEKTKN